MKSFWMLFKQSVASTHIHVYAQYTDKYLREFRFRSNHRSMQKGIFDLLIGAI